MGPFINFPMMIVTNSGIHFCPIKLNLVYLSQGHQCGMIELPSSDHCPYEFPKHDSKNCLLHFSLKQLTLLDVYTPKNLYIQLVMFVM